MTKNSIRVCKKAMEEFYEAYGAPALHQITAEEIRRYAVRLKVRGMSEATIDTRTNGLLMGKNAVCQILGTPSKRLLWARHKSRNKTMGLSEIEVYKLNAWLEENSGKMKMEGCYGYAFEDWHSFNAWRQGQIAAMLHAMFKVYLHHGCKPKDTLCFGDLCEESISIAREAFERLFGRKPMAEDTVLWCSVVGMDWDSQSNGPWMMCPHRAAMYFAERIPAEVVGRKITATVLRETFRKPRYQGHSAMAATERVG